MKEPYIHHREKLSDVTRDLAAVAMGNKAADLLIKNGKLVNVNVGYIQENIDVAVVSMPSMEVFEQQSAEYKESVLPKYVPTFAVEAGVTLGWTRYTKREDRVLGIDTFGASAPGGVVAEHYGMTGVNVAAMVKAAF